MQQVTKCLSLSLSFLHALLSCLLVVFVCFDSEWESKATWRAFASLFFCYTQIQGDDLFHFSLSLLLFVIIHLSLSLTCIDCTWQNSMSRRQLWGRLFSPAYLTSGEWRKLSTFFPQPNHWLSEWLSEWVSRESSRMKEKRHVDTKATQWNIRTLVQDTSPYTPHRTGNSESTLQVKQLKKEEATRRRRGVGSLSRCTILLAWMSWRRDIANISWVK